MFNRQFKYSHVNNVDDDTDETSPRHPLDYPMSAIRRFMNSLFFIWLFKIVSIGKLNLEDVPKLPRNYNSKIVYSKWKSFYNKREMENKSVTTASMIFHFKKWYIIRVLILQTIGYIQIFCAYYIFKYKIWIAISNEINVNIFGHVLLYSGEIFILFTIKSILLAYSFYEAHNLGYIIISSCLYISLYKKTLSLHLNDCDKQKVLSVSGSDIDSIRRGIFYMLIFIVPVIIFMGSSIIMLIWNIGISSIFGIILVIFIGIPFQLYLGYKMSLYAKLRMKCSDSRIQLITELIRGIRFFKLNATELPLMNRVNEYRKNELNHIKTRNYYLSLVVLTTFLIPALLLFFTLMVYLFIFGYKIDSHITLFMLIIMTFIQFGVRMIPITVAGIVSFVVGCKRFDSFLERQSINIERTNDNINNNNIAIELKNASFEWNHEEKPNQLELFKDKLEETTKSFSFKDISLKIKCGKLIAIMGTVGSGKSSLFHSFLGEMKCINGEKNINLNEIIYCAQTPFILNCTLRENIILELKYDIDKYRKCIIASALQSDLVTLPNSDMTLIGDEGVNLSGGQRMRIAFARALYRKNAYTNKNIFLFDDTLSSVDIFVGRQMFINGISKLLVDKNNTCLMIINSHLNLLKYFDDIIIMEKSKIVLHTSVKNLFSNTNNLLTQYQHLLPNLNSDEINNYENIDKIDEFDEFDEFDEKKQYESEQHIIDELINDKYNINNENDTVSLIPNWLLFVKYIKSSIIEFDYKSFWFQDIEKMKQSKNTQNRWSNSIKIMLPLILCMIIQCMTPICDLLILLWTQKIEQSDNNNLSVSSHIYYLSIWCITLCIIGCATVFCMKYLGKITLNASNYIHNNSLYNVLRASTLFFDTTPRGHISHRFTTDTNTMDIVFTDHVYTFMVYSSSIIGYFILIMFFIPISLIPIAVILPIIIYINYKFGLPFVSSILLAKDHDSKIPNLFTESVIGLDSIRSANLQMFFTEYLHRKVDIAHKCWLMKSCLPAWLMLYQEILLNILQFIVIMCAVYQLLLSNKLNDNSRQFIILACWYFLSLQQQINTTTLRYYQSKDDFISILRVMYYDINTEFKKEMHECANINHDYTIAAVTDWPKMGNININKVKLRYRPTFDIVLNIENEIKIKHGQKIGICGRTGSGKSSILVSIFRLFEPIINDIIIDKLNISELGLYDLRSNLSIISQTPVLMNGTLRFNIDPFHEYSDDEIWDILKIIDLFDLINDREGNLNCSVHEGGINFSNGEKQLICFARALLKKSSCFFMDEPTSSLDKKTDKIIQTLIRSERFKNITVICIAHRIQTIIDYDKILLLKHGKIKAYDTPKNLLLDENGEFANLLKTDRLNL